MYAVHKLSVYVCNKNGIHHKREYYMHFVCLIHRQNLIGVPFVKEWCTLWWTLANLMGKSWCLCYKRGLCNTCIRSYLYRWHQIRAQRLKVKVLREICTVYVSRPVRLNKNKNGRHLEFFDHISLYRQQREPISDMLESSLNLLSLIEYFVLKFLNSRAQFSCLPL